MKTFSRLLIALFIVASLLSSSSATILAQADPTVEPTVSDQAPTADVPTEAPLSTEIPPTEIPPTEVPPTETPPPTAPATDVPTSTIEPTPTSTTIATETPTPMLTPSPTPSPSPSPTLTPTPTEEPRFGAAAEILTLTFSLDPAQIGAPFTAQASGSIQLLGTIVYTSWDGPGCTGTATVGASQGIVTAIPASAPRTFNTLGVKSFRAQTYTILSAPLDTSPCTNVTVAKRTPTLTVTPPTAVTVTAGESQSSSSALTNHYLAGGNVTYAIFPTSDCTGTPTTITAALSISTPGTMPGSGGMILNLVNATTTATNGTLYWRAVYSGDANNEPATSNCASKTVDKKTTTLTHTAAPTSSLIAPGSIRVSSLGTTSVLAASGTVTFTLYSGTGCVTLLTPSVTIVATVTNGVVPNSAPLRPTTIGSFSAQPVYSGDVNNRTASGPCHPITFTQATPVVGLAISPSSVALGGSATGTSTLTSSTPNAGGTLTYTVYSEGTCNTQVVPAKTSTVTVVNGVAPASTSFTFATAGILFWRAVYAGDANNATASSLCVSFVVLTLPTLTTGWTANPINAGGSTTATATLSGATSTAGGTVTYAVFSNSGCTTGVTSGINGAKTVTNAVVPNSSSGIFGTAGTFYVNATYSGDTLNNAATSGCATLTVAKLSPALSMSQSPNPVAIGESFAYGFSLTTTTGAATGTVTLQLYPSNSCGTPISGQTYGMTVSGSTVPNSPSIAYIFAGIAYARATYGGDANHNSATTTCIAVGLVTGSLSASLSNAALISLPYSNNAQVNPGQLTLTVSDPRGTAAGWSVTIVAGPFVYSGTAVGQGSIPAANFALTGTGAPTTVIGQPIGTGGPVASGATGTLNTSRTIIVASLGYGSGTYNQILNVNLTIPATSKAGTYTSTVTVTTAAAP